jgi:hypothetical protein
MSNLIITSGSEGSELSEAYIAERILPQWANSGSRHPGDLLSAKKIVCRFKNTGDRTPDSGSGEVGEKATPAFAANDGPETSRRTVRVCRFLKREKKAACVFLYVGGVKVSKKIREYGMGAYEVVKLFIVSHEEGRYELA